jgi:hypothetical protein
MDNPDHPSQRPACCSQLTTFLVIFGLDREQY